MRRIHHAGKEPLGSLLCEPLSPVSILVLLIIGLMLYFVTVSKIKAKSTTIRTQAAENSYMKDGSLIAADSREMFLYKNVTRTKRSNERSEGGSSTHFFRHSAWRRRKKTLK